MFVSSFYLFVGREYPTEKKIDSRNGVKDELVLKAEPNRSLMVWITKLPTGPKCIWSRVGCLWVNFSDGGALVDLAGASVEPITNRK